MVTVEITLVCPLREWNYNMRNRERERERWIERIKYRASQDFRQCNIERTSNIHGPLCRTRNRSVACLSSDGCCSVACGVEYEESWVR